MAATSGEGCDASDDGCNASDDGCNASDDGYDVSGDDSNDVDIQSGKIVEVTAVVAAVATVDMVAELGTWGC
jgi:hypothetical protein